MCLNYSLSVLTNRKPISLIAIQRRCCCDEQFQCPGKCHGQYHGDCPAVSSFQLSLQLSLQLWRVPWRTPQWLHPSWRRINGALAFRFRIPLSLSISSGLMPSIFVGQSMKNVQNHMPKLFTLQQLFLVDIIVIKIVLYKLSHTKLLYTEL